MKVLFFGDMTLGWTAEQRARALSSLGFNVIPFSITRFRPPPQFFRSVERRLYLGGLPIGALEPQGLNQALVDAVVSLRPDICWIEKGLYVRRATVEAILREHPACRVIGFSPDDMGARHNRSYNFDRHIDLYHAYLTTKSYNVPELLRDGCPRVVFVPNAFDPETHHPTMDSSVEAFRAAVSFVGTYETERAKSIGRLANAGIGVRVWGSFWDRWPRPVSGVTIEGYDVIREDYARAISGSDINLCFLRKINRDLQTTRSVEIPATGGFMLAERTDEHRELFEEGVEAEYFGSDDELVEKCRYYLDHPEQRKKIAAAGRARCLNSHYDYRSRLAVALKEIGIAVAESPRS